MWILTIRSPKDEPFDYVLRAGKNTLGRRPDNDIVIIDESASRHHAEIYCQDDEIVIHDLKSLNGTYVNRERILTPTVLKQDDQIRIGQNTVTVTGKRDTNGFSLVEALSGTRPLTRELLLESVDKHAVLLFEVSSRLSAILDLGSALQEISTLMKVYMGADQCEVILADQFDEMMMLGIPTSIAQQAIEERSVVHIANPKSKELKTDSASLLRIRSVLCVPVLVDNSVAALIYVHKTDPTSRPFDQNDVQIAVAISHQATLAFQRSQLMDQSRELEFLAITDSMTGLVNRRQFLKIADIEYMRARRFHHPLTLILFDVDDFKRVNDTYGHETGDQVLKAVAGRCLEQLRGIDLLGRYGGDEFTVLLVETNLDGGKVVAERLRRNMANTPVNTDRGHGLLEVTISLGIATLTDDCPNMAGLIKRADEALYKAKRAGKNQIGF